jgi:uncharacterized protein
MLRVDIRALRQGASEIDTEVEPGAPAFQGLEVRLDGAVRVVGTVRTAGPGTFRWAGRVQGRARGECRRRLADVITPFDVPCEAVYTTSEDLADDPGVYRLLEPVTVVDLAPAVREEVGFAVPTYPLCREDCAGLCPRCGADLNQGPCGCAAPEPA